MYKKGIKKTAKRTDRTYYVGCYVEKGLADNIAKERAETGKKITDIVNQALKDYFYLNRN